MIDFEIPEETKAIRNKVRKFVQEECHPAEESCTAENFETVLAELLHLGSGPARFAGYTTDFNKFYSGWFPTPQNMHAWNPTCAYQYPTSLDWNNPTTLHLTMAQLIERGIETVDCNDRRTTFSKAHIRCLTPILAWSYSVPAHKSLAKIDCFRVVEQMCNF